MKKVIKKSSLVIAILVSLVIFVKIISSEGENKNRETPIQEKEIQEIVEVAEVIDGDTIRLKSGRFLRYIGIDTPEREECFYEEAKEENKKFLQEGKIRIVKDVSENDKYGRLLRYVYLGHASISHHLVREGFARAANFPPDEKFKEELKAAEVDARENGRGMWGEDVCK